MKVIVKELQPDIFWVYTPSYYNCTYILKKGTDVVLIDAGMRSDASDIKGALERIGIPVKRITAVILTHWHNDHSAGTAVLKELSGCKTFCHIDEADYFQKKPGSRLRRLADFIPERGILVLFKGLIGDVVPRRVTIDHLVSDGDVILQDLEVIKTPGHTNGHIAIYDRSTAFLFAGDALAVIHQRLRLMAGPVTPDKENARASIMKLLSGRMISSICPGHREPLVTNVEAEIARFRNEILHLKRWPLLG
ncbi:MBL fold metallo-hydrolase [Niabella aurantiaca]|uniref:MBL fold metallo-hydrolase n=1 Tax=Niabella aurantiaca TaxID=379900 RepID=UPI0003796827|nr:MBL fold metallo-hydrolase [Niabella aurantiaca]